MRVVPLKNKDEIIEEVRKQLTRFMMSDKHTIQWLEDESRETTEYPIDKLSVQAGYNSTAEFLLKELYDYVQFVGRDLIRAGPKLYDTDELTHIVDLHARTVPKDRNTYGNRYGGRGGGRAGPSSGNSNYYSSSNNHAPPYQRRQQQQSSNYQSTNFQQQRQQQRRRSPSPAARKHSPPTPPTATPFNRQPTASSTTNFSEHSSATRISPNLIAGPPPGFEKLLQRENDSRKECKAAATSSDSDPFNVKTAITVISRNGSSPDHRPPPDPRNAREAAEKATTLLSSPPGYNNPPAAAVAAKSYDPYGFDSSSDEDDNNDEEDEFFDALEEQPVIKLPPCRSFSEEEEGEYEETLQYHFHEEEIIPKYQEDTVDQDHLDDDYLNYYVNVITAIHYNIPNKSKALFYEVIKNLPVKISHQPGFDPFSLFSIIKALGPDFIAFFEEFNPENGMSLIYVKSVNRGMKKDEYRELLKRALIFLMPKLELPLIVDGTKLIKAIIYEGKSNGRYFIKASSTKAQEKKMEEMLSKARTINLINPYPHALCLYYLNRIPYRAKIIAQIDSTNISIELVDVGEFLTVSINDLKAVEDDILAMMPRFAIPCQIQNDKMPNMRKAVDGFHRRSTCKSVPMYLTQMKEDNDYVLIELF